MITTILTVIHITVCLFLVVIVLLQHGKGASIGASFGGASNTLFGADGPVPLMNKVTTGAAIIFMLTSISLAFFSSHQGTGSVMSGLKSTAVPAPVEKTAGQPAAEPAMPAVETPAPATEPAAAGGTTAPNAAEQTAPTAPSAPLDLPRTGEQKTK